jgi:signal transduction histidine kinase
MGLWTVKHIVTKHGGTIAVQSKPGEGTRFALWWPREYAALNETAPADIRALGKLA